MKPMHRKIQIAVLLSCLIAAPLMAQTMYRWVDENGTVHFGENPPAGVEAAPINVDLTPEPVTATSADTTEAGESADAAPEISYAEQRRQEREKMQAEAREQAARTEAACASQQSVLDNLLPRPNVLVEQEDGTIERMDDEERQKLIQEAQDFISKNCQGN